MILISTIHSIQLNKIFSISTEYSNGIALNFNNMQIPFGAQLRLYVTSLTTGRHYHRRQRLKGRMFAKMWYT